MKSCGVVHAVLGERRTLDVLLQQARPPRVVLRWPLYGPIEFNTRDGLVRNRKLIGWRLDDESLASIQREMGIIPNPNIR